MNMISMTLEQITNKINTVVDEQLVKLAKYPQMRDEVALPSLVDAYQGEKTLSLLSYQVPICVMREVMTYKYLLDSMSIGLLPIGKEALFNCLKAMRKSPFILLSDWADYHRFASAYYESIGDGKKASRHEKFYLMYDTMFNLDANEKIDCSKVLKVLHADKNRYKKEVLYVFYYLLKYSIYDAYEYCYPQSDMIESVLQDAVDLYAMNEQEDIRLGKVIYYMKGRYEKETLRFKKAEDSQKQFKAIGGKSEEMGDFMSNLYGEFPDLLPSEKEFIDFIMTYMSRIGTTVEIDPDIPESFYKFHGLDPEFLIDGRFNSSLLANNEFNHYYIQAEKGNREAIKEVIRRYREGDGVSICLKAADEWQRKLVTTD